MSPRGPRVIALLAALTCLAGCTGCGHSDPGPRRSPRASARPPAPVATARSRLGLPPVASGSILPGYLLIADRDNDRLIVVSPDKRVVWRFPRRSALRRGQAFAGPDDAFVTPGGRSVITNEEFSDTVALVSLGSRPRILSEYGHQDAPGSGPGYLSHPDDAYLLPDGQISIADIVNCRVLWLARDRRVLRSIGSAGNCQHDPPRQISQPNGDTPLPDGGVLVTEIGGWVDRFDRRGRLRWSTRTPTDYPSDAQLLPGGDVLVAGFNTPGRVDVITPSGRIVWSYHPTAGPGALDRPSLAVPMPNGTIAVTDDWHHRVVLIDRRSKRIVWQYGHLGSAGSGPGYLDKPDGLDLIR